MPSQSPITPANWQKAVADLTGLAQFDGPPKEFWLRFLQAAVALTQADQMVLLAQKADQGWRRMLDYPAQLPPGRMLSDFAGRLEQAARTAVQSGLCLIPLEVKPGSQPAHFVIAVRLELPQQPQENCVLAGLLSETTESAANDALLRLRLTAQTAQCYQINLSQAQARGDAEKFSTVLDLFASFATQHRYVGLAMGLCNALAAKFNCDRVSLGYLKGGYIQLQAISRTESFDRHMAAVKALEIAMEEALDQDNEILWPAPEDSSTISYDHEEFARVQRAGNICSLPLRIDDSPLAVITCERQAAHFSLIELQQLRLTCDLAAPRLAELRRKDLWFGARWAEELRTQSARVIGPEHTLAKMLTLLVMVLLVLLVFLRLPYRVEGNFILRSGQSAYLSSPFDGYIDKVFVRPGDLVQAGQPLLQLKTAELELEEAYTLADLNRYLRDAEKARAAKMLAEMRIAEAMADQARARLDLARYRLKSATIRAEFPGVVIEGDLRERLGSPVKTADVLFRVARIDKLYAEAEVNERDVHEILGKTSGQIAFVGRPKTKFPIHIITVEPAAVAKNEANLFLVRCDFDNPAQPWWRPGMSGVCKFNVGKRALVWILSHRTVDFLRVKLWW